MKWKKDLKKAPAGTLEFCDPDGDVYQGELSFNSNGSPCIYPLILDSHGCGCCSDDNPLPIAWRHPAKPPTWLKGEV